MGTLEDLDSKKVMSTELKKLDAITNLLNILICLFIIITSVQSVTIYKIYKNQTNNISSEEVASLKKDIEDVKKAVHFRYFNLTNSLQDINKVKIETKHGRVVK